MEHPALAPETRRQAKPVDASAVDHISARRLSSTLCFIPLLVGRGSGAQAPGPLAMFVCSSLNAASFGDQASAQNLMLGNTRTAFPGLTFHNSRFEHASRASAPRFACRAQPMVPRRRAPEMDCVANVCANKAIRSAGRGVPHIQLVIPGPSPASSATEPGIQLFREMKEKLDSGLDLR
ncbi:MAG: hypothetical protein ACREPJ_15010 [Rhodanobacteraceae bacterium]